MKYFLLEDRFSFQFNMNIEYTKNLFKQDFFNSHNLKNQILFARKLVFISIP